MDLYKHFGWYVTSSAKKNGNEETVDIRNLLYGWNKCAIVCSKDTRRRHFTPSLRDMAWPSLIASFAIKLF